MQNFKKHPTFTATEDINILCEPLKKFNITYFGHANIDKNGCISGLANQPNFFDHYLKNEYYNADIHMVKEKLLGPYVLWDALELDGETNKLDQDSSEFGVRHTFSIVQESAGNKDFYHFSTHIKDKSINQVYLSNYDLLNKFIEYFKNQTLKSKEILKAYDMKFPINTQNSGFNIINTDNIADMNKKRLEIMQYFKRTEEDHHKFSIQHRKSKKIIDLAPQQFRCLDLLLKGHSLKEIGRTMNLSPRTIEYYLKILRKHLGCKNGKELIAEYSSSIDYL